MSRFKFSPRRFVALFALAAALGGTAVLDLAALGEIHERPIFMRVETPAAAARTAQGDCANVPGTICVEWCEVVPGQYAFPTGDFVCGQPD
ncbi:MAG: hypothetical protein AAGN66_22370 [Acidobacteriota bacterium]